MGVTTKRHTHVAIVAGLFLLSLCHAQFGSSEQLEQLRRTMQTAGSEARQGVPTSRIILTPIAKEWTEEGGDLSPTVILDKSIDPDRYILGPGDRLTAYLWGGAEKILPLTVGNEGKIVVPAIGEIDARGLTLSQARTLLIQNLSRVYKNVTIYISLTGVRIFKTFITGDVQNPGVYVVDGVTRVADLILLAGGTKSKSQRRGIQILLDSAVVGYADAALFENSGDLSGNPYLGEGQRVHIPPRRFFVGIYGGVNYEGIYDFVEGDRLGDMIRVAGGLKREADSTNIIVKRFTDDVDGLETLKLSLPADAAFLLKPDDRILVSTIPDYRQPRNVLIEGEVNRPGIYPIQKDKTRLADVIDMAGGLTDNASLVGSFVIRNQSNRSGNTIDPQRLLRVFETARVDPSAIQPSDLSYIKAEYVERAGKVSVDFKEALANRSSTSNIILRENDHIFIARKDLTVRIMGAVRSPGQVSYNGSGSVGYYIERAGGFNRNANRGGVVVRKNGSDAWLKAAGQKVEAGDAILVPERKYRDAFNVIRDGLGIAASVATVIISAITIATYINPPQ